jgi:magnesium chelatase family protein
MLVGAANPCPCGFAADPRRCRCSEADHARHARRLSGPLLDRIDLNVAVERQPAKQLMGAPFTDSATARAEVMEARERQARRFAAGPVACNAQMDAALLRRTVRLDSDGQRVLDAAYARGFLTARGRDRVLKVARTAADLGASEQVRAEHVHLALSLRGDEPAAEMVA